MRTGIQIVLLLSLIIVSLCDQKRILTIHEEIDPQLDQKIKELKPITRTSSNSSSKQSKDLNFKYYIFEQECFETFFTKKDFFNFFCLKLTLSKFLGYILVYGALAVKVPQILKIILNRSVVGISYSSVIIETFMNALLIGYNLHRGNPFSIYGQNVFLGIANLFIIGCFFMFSRNKKYGNYIKGLVILIAMSAPLILQLAPDIIIQNSIWLGIVAFLVSRLQQVRENYKNKSTGNLSFLTVILNFGGNIARTFTVLTQASNDTLYLISNVLPIFVNGTIVIQFILYWKNKITYDPIPKGAKDTSTSHLTKNS